MPDQRTVALEGEHGAGPEFRAAAIIAGWNGDELLAIDHEGGGKALRRGSEPGLPQGLSRLDVESPEGAVPVADKADAARRGHRAGEEGGTLLHGPDRLQVLHPIGAQTPQITVRRGCFEIADHVALRGHTDLHQGKDDRIVFGNIAGGWPVMA